MAGRPKRTAFHAAADKIEDDILGWVADGVSLREIMRRITEGNPLIEGLTGLAMFYGWRDESEQRKEAYRRARALSAESKVADIEETLTNSSAASIAVDRERVKFNQWLAARYNRADYGDENKLNIAISLPDMHLQALRELGGGARSLPAPPGPALPEPEEVDFEVVE